MKSTKLLTNLLPTLLSQPLQCIAFRIMHMPLGRYAVEMVAELSSIFTTLLSQHFQCIALKKKATEVYIYIHTQ